MGTNIRELIFNNILVTLQGITLANGYNYSVEPENVLLIHGKRDDSAYLEPVIYIYPGAEVTNLDKGERGYDYNELRIYIEAWIRGEKEQMSTNINNMLTDLKTALGADASRGGYAVDTAFLSNDTYMTDLTSERCGIVLEIQVDYTHLYGAQQNNKGGNK